MFTRFPLTRKRLERRRRRRARLSSSPSWVNIRVAASKLGKYSDSDPRCASGFTPGKLLKSISSTSHYGTEDWRSGPGHAACRPSPAEDRCSGPGKQPGDPPRQKTGVAAQAKQPRDPHQQKTGTAAQEKQPGDPPRQKTGVAVQAKQPGDPPGRAHGRERARSGRRSIDPIPAHSPICPTTSPVTPSHRS